MVFMLRLIPGVLLFFLCTVNTAEIQKLSSGIKNSQVTSTDKNNTNEYYLKETDNDTLNLNYKYRELADEDVENIVKPFKFAKTNVTSLKLKKSESYTTTQKSFSENSRTGSGRSVDIDIEKYISPDFYNAVYTVPVSPNTKPHTSDEEIHGSHSTEETGSFENIGHLTTPKTPYFDEKYKQTVDSVNQKLEDSLGTDFDNGTHSSNNSLDNLIEEVDKNLNLTKFEFRNFKNIELNKTQKPHGGHREVLQETRKILSVENQYNDTKTYDENVPSEDNNELHKDNIKYLLSTEDVNEVRKEDTKFSSTVRSNFEPTTRKYSFTKPPTENSDASIISNKIENENVKSLPITTSEVPTTIKNTKRGSIKFADYQKSSTTSTPAIKENKTFEQVVQENQIVPIQITPPTTVLENTISQKITPNEKIESSSPKHVIEESTTQRIKNSAKNITIQPEEQQSTTVLIFVQPDTIKPYTTTETSRTTTLTSIPRGFRLATTTENIIPTTEWQEETTEEISTQQMETTTTAEEKTTTEVASTEKMTTTEISRSTSIENIETTTLPMETTTMDLESTTFSELRSSKHIKFETTSPITTTESFEDSTIALTTATYSPTTTEEIKSATEERTTLTSEDTTTEVTTNITESPTKTLLDNQTATEKSTQGSITTTTTSIDFVHIKNIDKNHTTLLPDVLKPNEIYTTPVTSVDTKIKPSTKETNITESSTRTETSTRPGTTETTPDDTTHSSELDGPGGNGAIVAIIISCVGGVCLIILACLLIVMRNRQQRFNYGQRCRPVSLDDYSVDNVSVFNSVRRKAAIRGSKMSYGNPAFEDPVCVSHPLNFPAISKFANNHEDVNAEFDEIPQIIARTSELPEGCETKNRYANVIPLPESRVFLNSMEGYPNSDYINANFVTGPKNIRKYYIACQAPMSNSVDDFWRMIWEQQCKVVLMLTHLFENGVEKCFDYLPPSEVLDCHRLFGDFQVTLKREK
ncbi:hypothetical protein HHI36_017856 [Cryptolaemus montrouzieri]|uniref:protein-tyrosine-phosphatase n=1 Tax=Cryptolaemus montrouzieri TaxID=559131 RepID=A0ABD2NPE5_9CUCU